MPELTSYWRNPNYPEFGTTGVGGRTLILLAIEPYNWTLYRFRPDLEPGEIIELMEQLSTAVTHALTENLSGGHTMQAWNAQLADGHQLRTLPMEAHPLAERFNEILNTCRQRPKPPLFDTPTP